MYDPVLGRFLSPDPYVQSPLFSQNFNRYAYCWNNPLRFNDPDGEWIHIAIGALVGGVINWGAHGFRMDMEGLKAFGIGAATGAVGAATFGVGLGAMGVAGAGLTSLGAVGGGGFLAGLGAGAFSYMASTPILSIGNNIAFNDPIPTPDEYIAGLGFAALAGGLTQGLAAHMQGNNFLDGSLKESALINNAQVSAINEGLKAPMAAADDMDAALMERLGNKTVDNFLDRRISGELLSDDAFVHITTPKGATAILDKGLDPKISGYVTKWKYVKDITDPKVFNTKLYSQKLWPQTIDKFDDGFKALYINAKPTFFSPRTNWVNGVPQYRFYSSVHKDLIKEIIK
jgi:hypothetical protein